MIANVFFAHGDVGAPNRYVGVPTRINSFSCKLGRELLPS